MKKLLFFIFFNVLLLPCFAVQVSNFTELSDAVSDEATEIELTDDITFTSPLIISTNTSLSTINNSTYTVTGGVSSAPILTFTGADSSISNIHFSSTTQNNSSFATVYINIPAVTQNYSTFTIDNVHFYNNLSSTTSALGGALHINSQQKTTITNSIFSSNSALGTGANGGAIYYNGPQYLTITDTDFSSNTATQDGGAIYASSVTLIGSSFYGNETIAGNGGAIYSSSVIISSNTVNNQIVRTSFYNNYAEGSGGAIYVTDNARIDGVVFSGNISTNSAAGLGGAIYAGVGSSTTVAGDFMINRGYDGGAIYNEGNMMLNNTFLNANIALSNGGAIYNSAAGTMVISTSTFKSNRSVTDGGAIYTKGNLDIYNSNFSLNIAEGNGGALYVDNATVNLYNAMEFTNNISTGTGGAIHLNNSTLNINTEGKAVVFYNNSDGAGSNSNDIFMDAGSATNITGGGVVHFYDGVVGGSLTATDTNVFFYSTNAYDQTLTMSGGALGLLGSNTTLGTVNVNNTAISAQNYEIDNITATAFNLTGSNPVYIDVDPVSGTVDNFSGISGSGSLDINSYDQLYILYDQPGTSGNLIIAPGATVNVNTTEDFYGRLYIYNLAPVAGGFQTIRSNRLNPTISTLPVAANAKTVSNINTTASLFNRVDIMFSRDILNYIRPENTQLLDAGPYVDPENPIKKGPVPTQSRHHMAWFIPNGGYQKVDYGGTINDVTNVFYGGLVGIDFPFILEKETTIVPTLFMGYLGTRKEYEKVVSHNDSLAFGGMATFQKENVLLSAQMYVTNGPEAYSFKKYEGSFDIFSYSMAVKWEMGINLDDNVVLQPALTMFYNLSNMQNYVTANGASMYSSRFHNIMFMPSVKIMGAYNGWYPYLSLAYNFNAWQKGAISADNLSLPEYKLKDIAEVSVGLENTFWKEYSGYVQLSTYLGGARGLVFQMGLRGYIDF